MRHLPASLASVVAERHGIVARQELLAIGWSRHRIEEAVATGAFAPIHPGIYRTSTSPDTFESRCVATCLADPSLVVTGRAAARLWHFRHIRYEGAPIVLAAHDTNPISGGVLVRRTNELEAGDRVERTDGIVVANPVRTWFDCARDVNDPTFEAVTEWVLDRHTTVPTLWKMVRRMSVRGRPGAARVGRVMSQRSDWQKPAGSRLELRVLNALRAAGVPELVRQHPIKLSNGLTIHPDAVDLRLRWALEIDHVTWHGGRADAQRDKGRDRGLRRLGWQVERVSDQELRDDFDATIRDIAELYALRRKDGAA